MLYNKTNKNRLNNRILDIKLISQMIFTNNQG